MFCIGGILAIHPLMWIILLHYDTGSRRNNNNNDDDTNNNSIYDHDQIFNFMSLIILDILPRIVSNLLTCLFGLFFLITGIMNIRGGGAGTGGKNNNEAEGSGKIKTS